MSKSRLKAWRDSIGLDSMTALKMLKGALPPTIVTAMYQGTAVSEITTTVGYLTAIIAISTPCLMPRAMFMRVMFFNVLATCTSAAFAALGTYCAVKARQNSMPSNASQSMIEGYNSSACAVAGFWLLFNVWIANSLRSYQPQELQNPMVCFSLFSLVTMTNAGTVVTVPEGMAFLKQLLLAFLLGFAISIGVSLLILPITSRGVYFGLAKDYSKTVQKVLEAQKCYVQHLLGDDLFAKSVLEDESSEALRRLGEDPEAIALKSAMNHLQGIHEKLHANLIYANQELAFGKLGAKDLDTIFGSFRSVFLPLSGLAMLPAILQKLVRAPHASHVGRRDHQNHGDKGRGTWHPQEDENVQAKIRTYFLQALKKSLDASSELVQEGLEHALTVLEIVPFKTSMKGRHTTGLAAKANDVEAVRSTTGPEDEDFAPHFKRSLRKFSRRRQKIIQNWEFLDSADPFDPIQPSNEKLGKETKSERRDIKEEKYILLCMEHLQDILLQATLELVTFADRKVNDGVMKHNKLILPRTMNPRQWFQSGNLPHEKEGVANLVDSGASETGIEWNPRANPLEKPLDPEHLPPANAWEKAGNWARTICRLIQSDQSAFGSRVAAAALTVGILAYLHQTQEFFEHQRVIWAMIVIVIGMSPTSGASFFGFVARIISTIEAYVLSLVVWYIVDGKTSGVLVFLYFANCFDYYLYIKNPQLIGPCTIAIVTLNVTIAYQLQVRKLGIEEATSNGQPYYPLYLFGAYKLATVIAGCFVSFVWTVFPYPISAGSRVRQTLGRSLFVLAQFYSCMHTTIEVWMNQEQGDKINPQSPAYVLESSRNRLFAEQMSFVNSLQTHSHFATFEPPVGGKFPKATYDSIISEIQSIATAMSLMASTTTTLESLSADDDHDELYPLQAEQGSTATTSMKTDTLPQGKKEEETWIHHLARLVKSTDFNSHIITSLLCNLSAAVSNGSALPPYLSPLEPFPLARKLRSMNDGLLDIRNAWDPAFSAFAATEVLSSMVNSSLAQLVQDVKTLVGEVSFDLFLPRHNTTNKNTKQT